MGLLPLSACRCRRCPWWRLRISLFGSGLCFFQFINVNVKRVVTTLDFCLGFLKSPRWDDDTFFTNSFHSVHQLLEFCLKRSKSLEGGNHRSLTKSVLE